MIRVATPQDADWIAAIWNGVIDDTLFTFTTVRKTPTQVAQLIENRPVLVLSDARGFATYGPFRAGPGYQATVEHSVMVVPAAQGHGQGRRLLTALIQVARDAGHHVMVGGISSANPGAVAFHTSLGFNTVGHMPQVGRKAGQWLDLILMQKLLNPPDTGSVAR